MREGRLLARVRHPHVVTVFGADVRDQRVGIWMELVEGVTLEDELLARGPLPPAEVIETGQLLASALQAVHDAGLIHRDVKAQNVMRDSRDGRLVLMDFSAGREQFDHATVDSALPASLAGSPLYLAPELLAGTSASPRSDVYSLGVLLFRLLTGRYPVEAGTLVELDEAHRQRQRLDVHDLRPAAPESLAHAIEQALAPAPTARTASARDLGHDLTIAGRGPVSRWHSRSVAAAIAVLLAVSAGAAAWRWQHPPYTLPFAPRDWVLIADFENRTGNPAFDHVLEQALTRELTISRHVNVVPRVRIEDTLVLMRRPHDSPVDARIGREVSLRDGGIRAVLAGHISRVGTRYTLTTDIVDPADGRIHDRIELDVAAPEELLPRVREQALRVREALGEALTSLQRNVQALPQVTTPSLEALQLYSRAAALLEGEAWLARADLRSQHDSADKMLAQALERDPSFASAWMLRARAASARGRPPQEAFGYAERALSLAGQVTDEERYFIEGVALRMRADLGPGRAHDLAEAAQSLETLLRVVPDHYWALIELEPIYRRLRRVEDAERTALQAASLRPNSLRFAITAVRAHLRRRDRQALRQVATRALAMVPPELDRITGPIEEDLGFLRMWEAREAWLDADVSRLATLLEQYERDPQMTVSRAFLAWTAGAWLGMGRVDRAHQLANRESTSGSAFRHALIDTYAENWDAIRPRLRAQERNFEFVHRFSFMYIWAGLTDTAEWLVAERKRRAVVMNWQPQQEFVAQLRVAQGRHREALQLFEPILQDEQFPRLRMNELVALARRGTGDLSGAIVLLERYDRDPFIAISVEWGAFTWLSCQTRLAEFYLEAGRPADAARVAKQVRAHLVLSDADNPLIARLANLP